MPSRSDTPISIDATLMEVGPSLAVSPQIARPLGADLFSSVTVTDPFIGRMLDGRYDIVGSLGAGGVGFVYRAKHAQLGRPVAIKVLQQFAAADPEWRRRFAREAKALSALAHPNIVTVTDSGIADGVPYLVMELLEGKTLGQLLREGPIPPPRALDIARQMLRGLAFAHGKGIVHRDLKPANVFLQALPDQADHVRLLDFGMAKFLEGSGSRSLADNLTKVGMVCGTPAYMSPEQGRAEPVDARTDVYAAGIVLFELLTGRQPFRGDSLPDVLKSHLLDPIPSLADARPDLSIAAVLQPVIDRSMAKKPTGRFPDAASMLAALEAIHAVSRAAAANAGLTASRKEPLSGAGKARAIFAHSWKAAVGLASLAAAVTTVVTFLGRNDARPNERARPVIAQPPSSEVQPAPVAPSGTPLPQLKAKAQAPAQATAERPRLPARDPWREAVPAALEPIRARIDRGARLPERSLQPLYAYAHQHPDDPRPWLLLGRAYSQLDWRSDSVERYLRAYRIDPGCRGDPQMLADFLKAADHPVAGRAAAKAIGDVYGAEAIPAVDKELERRAGERDTIARLNRLRASLAR